MRIINTARGMGKTTKAVEHAIKNDLYLIVADRKRAQELFCKYSDKGLRMPVTFEEFLRTKMRGSFIKKIIIDDADSFVERVCEDCFVEMITLTDTNEIERGKE